jgi:hypothetical protein
LDVASFDVMVKVMPEQESSTRHSRPLKKPALQHSSLVLNKYCAAMEVQLEGYWPELLHRSKASEGCQTFNPHKSVVAEIIDVLETELDVVDVATEALL